MKSTSLISLGLLVVTGALLFAGERLGPPDLRIAANHISEFAARPDLSGKLVCTAMLGFAATYIAVAVHLLQHLHRSTFCTLGCVALSAASSLLPFTAEYRLYYQAPPPARAASFWDRWFPPQPPPGKPVDAVERERVHGNTIGASMLWVAAGITLIGLAARRRQSPSGLLRYSWCFAATAIVLFQLCQWAVLGRVKGLIEIAAFGAVAAWLALAGTAAPAAGMAMRPSPLLRVDSHPGESLSATG
jgi:hypothetical protein